MPNPIPSIRKAALLVRSLDTESAALLLAQLSPAEAKAVRLAIRELGTIDPAEQAQLADELRRPIDGTASTVSPPAQSTDQQPAPESDVELAFSRDFGDDTYQVPAMCAAGSPAPPSVAATMASSTTPTPFGWLEIGDIPTLAAMLEREHLSTVAVVLSHLTPDRAGELLAALPAGRRAAALERLADLGESDRESLEVLEKGLADWIAGQKRERQLRDDRLASVRSILTHTPGATRDAVLKEMVQRNSALAGEFGSTPRKADTGGPSRARVRKAVAGQLGTLRHPASEREIAALRTAGSQPGPQQARRPAPSFAPSPPQQTPRTDSPQFDFERLGQLSGRDLAEVLRHCDGESLVLALAGGSDETMTHVTSQLPAAMARELRRRVNHLSGVRLSDVGRAQERLCFAASELITQGRIQPIQVPSR